MWLLLALVGCGFQHGSTGQQPADGARRDAPADARADAKVADAKVFMDAPAPPSIMYVQGHGFASGLNALTISDAFLQAQTAHDLNLVVVSWTGTAASVMTLSDGAGNTYTRVGSAFSQGSEKMDVWYCGDIAGFATANTVTATFDATVSAPELRLLEYAGLKTMSPVDTTNQGQAGGSKTVTTGAATTTHAYDLLVGCETSTDTVKNLGTGYTLRVTAGGDIVEDKIVTSTGSYTADATLFNDADWMMRIVAFEGLP